MREELQLSLGVAGECEVRVAHSVCLRIDAFNVDVKLSYYEKHAGIKARTSHCEQAIFSIWYGRDKCKSSWSPPEDVQT